MSNKYKVRDKRNRGWFYLDNEYLNGLGKHLGLSAIGVYVSLCRHADNEQKCFPAQETIAEELGVSIATVKRYLRLLKKHNVIAVERVKKGRRWAHNVYYLLDKSEWIYPKKDQGSQMNRDDQGSNENVSGVTGAPDQGSQRATKDTNRKDTNEGIAETSSAQAFSLKNYIRKCYESPHRHVQLIALYMDYKQDKITATTKDQAAAVVKRHLRAAKDLMPWTDEQLNKTVAHIAKTADYDWTLESIYKHLTK